MITKTTTAIIECDECGFQTIYSSGKDVYDQGWRLVWPLVDGDEKYHFCGDCVTRFEKPRGYSDATPSPFCVDKEIQ